MGARGRGGGRGGWGREIYRVGICVHVIDMDFVTLENGVFK